MNEFLDQLAGRVEARRRQGRGRRCRQACGRDFASDDFLALAGDPDFDSALEASWPGGPVGSPAPRWRRGSHAIHDRFESRFAAWQGTEAALLLPADELAILALVEALAEPTDRLLIATPDRGIWHRAARLARCRMVEVPSLDALRERLSEPATEGRTIVAVRSVDGDRGELAPLSDFAALAAAQGAVLCVDDGEATGWCGPDGAGRVAEAREGGGLETWPVTVTISSGGRALGLAGGIVCGPQGVVDAIVHGSDLFSRATAVPPLVVHGLDTAVDFVRARPARRARVVERSNLLRSALVRQGVAPMGRADRQGGPVVPVAVGPDLAAVAAAKALERAGFDVRAIVSPRVATGSARLRLVVHADHQPAEIEALARATAEALEHALGRESKRAVDRGVKKSTPQSEPAALPEGASGRTDQR